MAAAPQIAVSALTHYLKVPLEQDKQKSFRNVPLILSSQDLNASLSQALSFVGLLDYWRCRFTKG